MTGRVLVGNFDNIMTALQAHCPTSYQIVNSYSSTIYLSLSSADYLRDLGFSKVIHEKKDFFERVKDKAFMKRVVCVTLVVGAPSTLHGHHTPRTMHTFYIC